MADTAVVGAATLVSRVLGFARNAVVSALLGQTWKADVLNAVFSIPMNLRKLVAEGAFSTAFIPVLARSLQEDPSRERAKRLVRGLFTLQILVLIPLTVLAAVFAPQVVGLLAPFDGAEQQRLAIDLFRGFILFLFLVSWSSVLMGVENTHQRFLLPALSPILFSVAVIGSLLIGFPSLGVYAQIPGVLLGGLLPILLQWFGFRRLGYSMVPAWRFWSDDLKQTLRHWGPALSVSGISLLNQQISVTLAATLPEGSVSALSNAIVFWQLPAGVLSASVITVYFPRMSRLAARADEGGLAAALGQGLALLAVLLLPAGLFLGLFAEPLIGLAFQRGLFTAADTVLAARVLAWLSGGLFLSGVFNFLQRYFYSRGDYRTPFWVSVVWATVDVIVSVVLMRTTLGVTGLAAGSVAGFAAGAGILLFLALRRLPIHRLGDILWVWLRCALALVPPALAWQATLGWTGPWWTDGLSWASLGLLAGEGLAACALYAATLLALGLRPWTLGKRPSEGT